MSQPATPACVTLPCEPRSASLARRFATNTLQQWGRVELEEVVTLLLSEAVTNALLHTGGDIEVCLIPGGAGVRAEVADRSTTMPSVREYGNEATTGRGLELVEALSSGWGVRAKSDGGKIVWFEVGGSGVNEAFTGFQPPAEPEVVVQLLNTPVLLFPAMHQHVEALVREYALLGQSGTAEAWQPPRLDVDVSTVIDQLRIAGDAGRSTADVTVSVAADVAARFASLRDAVDDADLLAVAGALLAPPALPEIAACRTWFLDQVTTQFAGGDPVPWQAPAASSQSADRDTLHDTLIVNALSSPVIVADDHNHILHANTAAEDLLGWPPGGLRGQRLTVIVPARLQDAHIAGYSRYLVTRVPRLIGTVVQVPARRLDGTEVAVWLELSTATSGGSPIFVATLRPAGKASRPGSPGAALKVITDLAAHMAREIGTVDRPAVLGVLAASGGWQFASWWEPQGDALICAETWSQEPGMYADFERATRNGRFSRGIGLPGRVWRDGRISWRPDVVADSNFPRASAAAASGLRGGCAFPIATEDGVAAVVELLSEQVREQDDDVVAALAVAGTMLGLANVAS